MKLHAKFGKLCSVFEYIKGCLYWYRLFYILNSIDPLVACLFKHVIDDDHTFVQERKIEKKMKYKDFKAMKCCLENKSKGQYLVID